MDYYRIAAMTFVRAQQLGGHSIVWAVWLRVKPEPSHSEPFRGKYPLVAVSVSTRRRQEADFRRDGPAGQSQLAAIFADPVPAKKGHWPTAAFRRVDQPRYEREFWPP